jgi:WD40 repeat protein
MLPPSAIAQASSSLSDTFFWSNLSFYFSYLAPVSEGLSVLPPLPGATGQNRRSSGCNVLVQHGRTLVAIYADGRRVVLDSNINPPNRRFRVFDPTCRYLGIAALQTDDLLVGYDSERRVIIYDLTTAERVAEFPNNPAASERVFWSPDGQFALIFTGAGAFLWDANTRTSVALTNGDERCPVAQFYPYVVFDPASAQLWITSSRFGSNVYDMRTGVCRREIGGVLRNLSGDVAFVNNYTTILLIDRYTLAAIAVLDNDPPARRLYGADRALAVSPGRRWFVFAGSYPAGVFSVWDLSNLPAELDDRDPLYVRRVDSAAPDAGDIIDAIRFLDGATMETTHRDGSIRQWDIATGTLLARAAG